MAGVDGVKNNKSLGSSLSFFPQWTRRVAMEGAGRDPLGLSRVSDALTNFLLPNIITTTDRARYYSFYTWAITDIEALRKTKSGRVSFEEEFQRREAAFALASRLGQKVDLPIVGLRAVSTILASADIDDNVDTDFRVLPSNSTGGLGQYYAGCLHALDLVRVDERGEWTGSTEQGQKLAEAFATATAKSPYLSGNWRARPRVPKKVLQESSEVFSLDALAGRAADTEREMLISMFFNLGESPSATRPLNRQATLGLFLHVLKRCEDTGVEVARRDVDGGAVFWPHYYSGLADDDNDLRYQPAPAFAEVHAFWRQFCAHQFLAFALEEFLAAVLDALSPHPEGLTEAALLDELVSKEFVNDLETVMQSKVATPTALLKAIGIVAVPDVATCLEVAKRFGGHAVVDEWSVCWDRDVSPQTRLGRAMLLLAMLYGKWRGRNDEDALLRVADEAKGELWLGTIFPWLDSWQAEQLNWRQAVKRLLEWTAMRHDQVKFQKRKLDASWFELANGRFVKQQDIVPGFRSSRHGNATTVLQDLGLIKHSGLDEPLLLTVRGKQVLDEVIRLRT
jgi:hypothetical protein